MTDNFQEQLQIVGRFEGGFTYKISNDFLRGGSPPPCRRSSRRRVVRIGKRGARLAAGCIATLQSSQEVSGESLRLNIRQSKSERTKRGFTISKKKESTFAYHCPDEFQHDTCAWAPNVACYAIYAMLSLMCDLCNLGLGTLGWLRHPGGWLRHPGGDGRREILPFRV